MKKNRSACFQAKFSSSPYGAGGTFFTLKLPFFIRKTVFSPIEIIAHTIRLFAWSALIIDKMPVCYYVVKQSKETRPNLVLEFEITRPHLWKHRHTRMPVFVHSYFVGEKPFADQNHCTMDMNSESSMGKQHLFH